MWCFTFIGMISWITGGPFLIITTFKLSALVFGILQAMVFGSLIVAGLVVRIFVESMGPKRLIYLGLAIALFGSILALISTALLPHFLIGLIISLMIFTFGSSLAFTPSHRIAVEACAEPMGARMSVFGTLMTFSGFAGSLLVSLTYTGNLLWFGILLPIITILACLTRWLALRFS
jgi:DHA1 family multidrug/chloramphenicol efflux transport protein-like MFS transporter